MTATTTAALLALVVVLILSTRPATAEERVLPGEAPDRDSAPASGLIWSGLGGTLTPPEPEATPMEKQQVSTPERATNAEKPQKPTSAAPPKNPANPDKKPSGSAPGGKGTLDVQQPPKDKTLSVTIPRLGLKDVRMPDSAAQSVLDSHGIMHLSGTGFPWQRLSNTYIAGHAQGYAGSRVPRVFEDLDDLRDGDRIIVRDANGDSYTYKVYKSMVVSPTDYWVTAPIKGKKVVTVQTCWPAPSYGQRLIVRAEMVR
jgi:sortase A